MQNIKLGNTIEVWKNYYMKLIKRPKLILVWELFYNNSLVLPLHKALYFNNKEKKEK